MNIHLKRTEGRYYLEVNEEILPIKQWEAERIIADREYVYEVIVDRKRKCNFNTAEDREDRLL